MGRHEDEREIVVVEREGGFFGPVLFGALMGLAVGLLFAPKSGAETRQALSRKLRKVRELAESGVGELTDKISEEWHRPPAPTRDERREEARGDLERRLAEARARRRATPEPDDDEEPVA